MPPTPSPGAEPHVKSSLKSAQKHELVPIKELAEQIGLQPEEIEPAASSTSASLAPLPAEDLRAAGAVARDVRDLRDSPGVRRHVRNPRASQPRIGMELFRPQRLDLSRAEPCRLFVRRVARRPDNTGPDTTEFG